MSARETYTVIDLMNGDKCVFTMPNGGDYSRAMQKHNKQDAYDLSIFFMAEICRIDEEIKDTSYYVNLGCDDYLKIIHVLNNLCTPIT